MSTDKLKQLYIAILFVILSGSLILAGYITLVMEGDSVRQQVEKRFNLRLEGRVVRVQPMRTGYDDGIVYVRLSRPVKQHYDPRDTIDFFYAVAEDKWAGINDRIIRKGGGVPEFKIEVGDSLVVEGRGMNDSLFVYRCDSLLVKKPIFVSRGSIYNKSLHRTFEWPPPDSLVGRGRAAHHARNCP